MQLHLVERLACQAVTICRPSSNYKLVEDSGDIRRLKKLLLTCFPQKCHHCFRKAQIQFEIWGIRPKRLGVNAFDDPGARA